MIKNSVIGVLFLVVSIGAYQYFNLWNDAKAKIEAAETKQTEVEQANVKLEKDVADLTKLQTKLDTQMKSKQSEITQHEATIKKLQDDLEIAKKATIVEIDEQAIANEFKKIYGVEDVALIRLIKVPMSNGWPVKSLVIPIDYIKRTITAKKSEITCKAQFGLQRKITTLHEKINSLQMEKFELEKEKTQAYANGYKEAFNMYIETNKLYLELLKAPPKIDFTPNWLQVGLGVLTGGLICGL